MTDGIMMEIVLAVVHKAGGKMEITRKDVLEAYHRFEKGDFHYGPQEDGSFLLEFKEPQ
jgi:hypothetical protein